VNLNLFHLPAVRKAMRKRPQPVTVPAPFQVGTSADVMLMSIPIRTVSEMNQREHWATRRKRKVIQQAHVAIAFSGSNATWWRRNHQPPYAVTLTRIAPRRFDSDNLASSWKHVQDEVARQLGIDDGSDLVRWTYEQKKGLPKQYAVEIRITTLALGPTPLAG
jgi:hypothetical protein